MPDTFLNPLDIAEQNSSPSSPPSGYQRIYPKTDGKIYSKTSAGVETDLTATGGGGAPFTMYKLTSAFPTVVQTNTTRVNVTGWSFAVTAGKMYKIEINCSFQTAATTTGGSMGVVLTSGAGTITGNMQADIVQTTVATDLRQTIRSISSSGTLAGSFMTSSGVGVINSDHNWYANLMFNCTSSGTFQVQWGTEVANSLAQIQPNAVMLVTEI